MQLARGIIAAGVRNPVLANLIMVCVLVGGYLSIQRMPSEAFPEYSLDIISIEVVYPGASPEDVERSVCIPIEEALTGMDGVYELTASAAENVATIWFPVRAEVRDVTSVFEETKARIEQITTLPPEIEKPIVTERTSRWEVISIAIHGDISERTLKAFAREAKTDLMAMPEISQVNLSGVRDDEIEINLSEESLRAYGLTFDEVIRAIRRGSLDLPAGNIRTAEEEVSLRVTGQRLTAAAYEDLVVIDRPDALVRLRDVATVREGFSDTTTIGRFNGEPAVVLNVFKTPKEDTTVIADLVRRYVAGRQASLPDRVHMAVWGDNSVMVTDRIGMLVRNGVAGLILVFITLLLFLEIRTAFWVAVGIPFSFAGAFILMGLQGESINMISLFALIMVSGIIVDDAIVIAESIHARRRAGDSPELASIEGADRVALPVLGSSLTTIIAFMPMLYVIGIMGKFVHILPIVVMAAIVTSAVEAFFILPVHLCRRDPIGLSKGNQGPTRVRRMIETAITRFIERCFRPVYRASLRYRTVTVSVAIGAFLAIVGQVVSGRTPFVLFAKEDGNVLRARVRFPDGTPLSVTQAAVARIEDAARRLNDDPELTPAAPGPLVSQVHSITGEFADWLVKHGNNLCEVRIELMPAEKRRIHNQTIISKWREQIGTIHDAQTFTIVRQKIGPIDAPLEIRLLGDDFDELQDAADQIEAKLAAYEGVTDVYRDLLPGKRELRIQLKPEARTLGLTLYDVATQLRQGYFGGEAVRVQRDREEVVVRVRYPPAERRSIADLESKRFRTVRGDEIPFSEAVDADWHQGFTSIMHQDGKRRVAVFADVDERVTNAEMVLRDLEESFLPELVAGYNDVRFAFGGNRKQMDESVSSLMRGFGMALVAIYAVLAALLRSYIQPIVILITVPLGLIGAVVGHMVFGYSLTLMSLFGVVALSGVVVNDALVLIDFINREIRDGRSVQEAVLSAGEARFRAVVLTTITTVAGLLPLLAERSKQAQSIIPMAISLSFGLIFATALTLLVVPCLYLIVNDVRRFVRWLRHGGAYPPAEYVEEAARERLAGARQ
ncbi:MAG: efflux RND transporter permease subunit [Planctomycetes bacterium]|nr:efflux RND transporter permease subunit [Planctomycetota bacterium]